MRNFLVATLALAPVLAHAQALPPAQPGANAPVLESKLVSPAAVDGAAAANVGRPVSVLLQPRLIKSIPVAEAQFVTQNTARFHDRFVTIAMTVTPQGVPTHMTVVASDDPLLNRNVVEAVAQYRFAPGTLDAKPTAFPLVLKVHVLPHYQ